METKITTSSVRVMLSFNFSNFEISLNLENENGISMADIDTARKDAQLLATNAVAEYKSSLSNMNPLKEVKSLEKKLNDIKDAIAKPEKQVKEVSDPNEVAAIMDLPVYTPPAKVEKVKSKRVRTSNLK